MEIQSVVKWIAQLVIGLTKAVFLYSPNPNIATIIGEFASNPCSVSQGLISFLALEGALPFIGIAMIAWGAAGVFSFVSATILAPLLAIVAKVMSLIGKIAGGGSAGGGRSDVSIPGALSPGASLILVIMGGLIASNPGAASEIVRAIFSVVSGAGVLGVVFLMNMLTMIVTGGSPACMP